MRSRAALALVFMLLAACSPARPGLNDQIRMAVAETLAAMPTKTILPPPPPAATPTIASLRGLFCEYEFCIGHPQDLAFYDVIAKQNPNAPTASRYDDGILAANNSSVFIEVIWQNAAPGADPQSLLNLILDARVDTPSGASEHVALQGIDASYVPVQSTATALLPYGGAGTWSCGGRLFAWKAYTGQPDLAKQLLTQALQSFRCNTTP